MMDENKPPISPPESARIIRRRASFMLLAFVVVSSGVHFTLGPEITKLAPHWAASNVPDQALSIVTLSHKEELQRMRPTPTPSPPPIPLPHTKRDLALLKGLEMGQGGIHMRPFLRPPARRLSKLIIDRVPKLFDEKAHAASVAAAAAVPTPAAQPPGSGRADTGSTHDDLSGSIVWGDDNPVRLLKAAPLGIDDHASGVARVEVDVDPDGHVTAARLTQSSGDPGVDDAALAAARASTFAPATLNGMPVHGSCVIEFPPPAQTT